MKHVDHIRHESRRGQILLITILVLAVATTIALSLIGRSTIDLSMSNQLEESSRAFSAAEAGIERALQSGASINSATDISGVNYSVTVAAVQDNNGTYALQRKTPRGVTETIWMVNHNDDGTIDETPIITNPTLNVCWSQEATIPALVVTVIYKEGTDGSYKAVRAAYDPDSASRGNNFDSSGITSSNGCGLGNFYQKQLNFASLGLSLTGGNADTLIELRIRPEYADAVVALGSVNDLPTQGNRIESVGVTPNGVTRKVVVYQQYRTASSIFDNVIYSQSSFGHN